MKFIIVIILSCLSLLSYAADEKPTPDAVVVKVLDKPLPSGKEEIEKFLWDNFANKPDENKFNSYTTENWKETYATFATTLVKKASDQKLNSQSLRKALILVLADSKEKDLAYLPVGAYQTILKEKPVWIITVKWEIASPIYPDGRSVGLGHIRAFIFDQKTLQQVGFMTCG